MSKNKKEEKSSSFSHRVEICGQFLYGRLQVVYSFKAILEEAEQETRQFNASSRSGCKTGLQSHWSKLAELNDIRHSDGDW